MGAFEEDLGFHFLRVEPLEPVTRAPRRAHMRGECSLCSVWEVTFITHKRRGQLIPQLGHLDRAQRIPLRVSLCQPLPAGGPTLVPLQPVLRREAVLAYLTHEIPPQTLPQPDVPAEQPLVIELPRAQGTGEHVEGRATTEQ